MKTSIALLLAVISLVALLATVLKADPNRPPLWISVFFLILSVLALLVPIPLR